MLFALILITSVFSYGDVESLDDDSVPRSSIPGRQRLPGVSFVLRIRNEEQRLVDTLRSLLPLTIPHEIVIILHKCTDRSKLVALAAKKRGRNIRIYETDKTFTRAGYETLILPAHHPASIVQYYNRCFELARYNWLVKWDSDFIATSSFIDFLANSVNLVETAPLRYRICAVNSEARDCEEYMSNCLLRFVKYTFWEVCLWLLLVSVRFLTLVTDALFRVGLEESIHRRRGNFSQLVIGFFEALLGGK